jgi:hypothetical protein
MIRAVWLGTTCLAVIGALAAGKALTTPAASERPAVETTTGIGPGEETLTKADRLEIAYVRPEPPARPLLQPSEPPLPAIRSAVPPAETKIISRHWRDPNAPVSSAAKSKRPRHAVANKNSKTASKDNRAADRSKPSEQRKPCNRSSALGDLLRSLNLSPACDS